MMAYTSLLSFCIVELIVSYNSWILSLMIFECGQIFYVLFQELEFNWQVVVGTIIGFCGAAFGSVGGVGGGGIFVPMLTLVIGFDPKSATAISKCKLQLLSSNCP